MQSRIFSTSSSITTKTKWNHEYRRIQQRHLCDCRTTTQQQLTLLLFIISLVAIIPSNNSNILFLLSYTPTTVIRTVDHRHIGTGRCYNKYSHPIINQQRQHQQQQHSYHTSSRRKSSGILSRTRLFLLLDVPDDFFTITFPMLGILLSISKNFARIRMEERAWEQRLQDGREEYIQRYPSVTEYELRKKEAEQEWSAYGTPRLQQQQQAQRQQNRYVNNDDYDDDNDRYDEQQRRGSRRRSGVSVLDRDENEPQKTTKSSSSSSQSSSSSSSNNKEKYCMTPEEIELFELEYGILYDPYYDDPYTFDEIMADMQQQQKKKYNDNDDDDEAMVEAYEIDKLYGDIIFQSSGEIFYKDSKTNLYYRQGSKPRNVSFFG